MRWLLFLTLLLNWWVAFAQGKPLVLSGKLPADHMDIGPYTAFYRDLSGDTLPLSVIRTRPFQPFTTKPDERDEFARHSIMVTWLRFTVRNTHPTDTLRLLYSTWAHGLFTLYKGDKLIGCTGLGLPPLRRSNPLALLLTVSPHSEQTFYARVLDYFWSPTLVLSEVLSIDGSPEFFFQKQQRNDYLLLLAMTLLTGGLLFMSFYAFYSFLLAQDRASLFYTLYTGVSALLSFHAMNGRFSLDLLFPLRLSLVLCPFHVALITTFYVLFVADLLIIRNTLPRIWRVLQVILIVLIAQEIQSVGEWIYGRPFFLTNTVYIYAMVPSGLATVILLIITFRSQSPLRIYLLIGMSSLVGISFIPGSLDLYIHGMSPLADTFFNYPFFWIILGLAIEAFCFALARAYRSRLIALENSQIQQRYAQDLEVQLAQRTQEIEQQSHLLEAQHIRQLESEFGQKLADTEMTALRAQMNPHFIFNCLNSIKLYTLDNEADKASDYLTKFSRLIRLVLENSRSELVPLHNELEALQLYIELEAMRFKQKVQFIIQIAPDIDQRYMCIPPLLLQPYVENAIWHGLMHKPEGGTVAVEVTQPQDNLLHIEITDDGVGRERAAELKSKSAGTHKSFGMQVTADRIRMINQLYNTHTQAQVVDLVDSFGEACGTRVVLDIPV